MDSNDNQSPIVQLRFAIAAVFCMAFGHCAG